MKVKDSTNNNNNNNNNNNAAPKKVVNKNKKKKKKKKTKTGVAAVDDDTTKHSGSAAEEAGVQRKMKKAQKTQQQSKLKNNKKEVIDYSSVQCEKDKLGVVIGLPDKNPQLDNDPVGKVKNWLLSSQHPVDSSLIPKSKSTPIGLTGASSSPVKTRTSAVVHQSQAEKPKSRSTGNLQGANKNAEKEKLRLQVVYKPPFKFSLKLRKSEKDTGAAARVVVVDRSHRRSVPAERKRGVVASGPRTAMLLKTRDHKRSVSNRKARSKDTAPALSSPAIGPATTLRSSLPTPLTGNQNKDQEADIDSNIHTVPSDLEVLLSESEFLFSDA